jgi:glyoxylase-like metal-dependent hydrolase (beta-lactamase superfamily II)/ferredoxin
MASLAERLPQNAPGEFFVDRTCIDCDTCRYVAPSVYAELAEGYSYVQRQPATDEEIRRAQMALLACPTGSIGTLSRQDLKPARQAFPEQIEDNVYYCGFTAEASFGAASYFIQRPEGNILVDSPRAARPLLKRLEQWGGVKLMFLTHRDDVADHAIFRRHFGCERVLHRDDVGGGTAAIERQPEGEAPVRLDADLLMIPVPGHTRGHAVLLYRDQFLFTGDHLAWSPARNQLYAFRRHCWYSWAEQVLEYRFEWVLPGHGRRYRADSAVRMRAELERCLAWMRRQ